MPILNSSQKRNGLVLILVAIALLSQLTDARLGKFTLTREQRESDLAPDGTSSGDVWSCNLCKMTMFALVNTINLQATQALIESYAVVNICGLIAQNSTVCPGIVAQNDNTLVDALTSSILSPEYFCEEIAPACPTSSYDSYSPYPDVDTILSTKPTSLKDNNFVNNIYTNSIQGVRKSVKAVHFSDAHVDPLYMVGADS